MPDDSRIDIQFGANTAQLVTETQKAATAVENASKAMTGGGTAAKGMSAELQRLFDLIGKGSYSVGTLEKATNQLGKEFDKGAFGAAEYKTRLAELHSAYGTLGDEADKAGSKMHGQAGVMRELMVLAHEASQGQFKRFGGSLFVLAERIGGLGIKSYAAIGGVAAIAGAIYELAAHAIEAESAIRNVGNAYTLIGRSGEFSRDRTIEFGKAMHNLTGVSQTVGVEIWQSMVRVAGATDDARQAFARYAPVYAELSRISPQQGAQEFSKLLAKVAEGGRGVEELGRLFGGLTTAEREALHAAEANTDSAARQAVAEQVLNRVLGEQAKIMAARQISTRDENISGGILNNDKQGASARPTTSVAPKREVLELQEIEDRHNQTLRQREQIIGDIRRMEKALAEETNADRREELEDELKIARAQLDKHKDPGDATRMEKWKADLAKQMEDFDGSRTEMLSKEIQFWQNVIETQRLTEAESTKINTLVSKLRQQLNREDAVMEIAEIQRKLAEEKKNGDERIRLADELVAKAKERYHEDSKEFKAASAERVRIYQEETEKLRQLTAERLASDQIARTNSLAVERENIRFKQALRQGDAAQNLADDLRLLNMEYQLERNRLVQQQSLYKEGEKHYEDYKKALAKLDAKYNLDKTKAEHNAQIASARDWQNTFKGMTSGFGSAITGMITGAETFSQAIANIGQSILSGFVNMLMQMVEQWIVQHVLMDLIFGTSQATQQMSAAEANSGIAESHAEVAAVAAAASVAAIPFYGWMMAGPTAAATSAMLQPYVIAAGSMASAAGGWDQIPEDQVAQVHKDEMILPAALAGGIRGLIAAGYSATNGAANSNGGSDGMGGGGGGGPSTVIIQAMDAHDVRRVFKNNPRAVADGARSAIRSNLSARVR